jgi:hypothetical protein
MYQRMCPSWLILLLKGFLGKPSRVSLVTMTLAESATKGTFRGINGRFLGINVKGKLTILQLWFIELQRLHNSIIHPAWCAGGYLFTLAPHWVLARILLVHCLESGSSLNNMLRRLVGLELGSVVDDCKCFKGWNIHHT